MSDANTNNNAENKPMLSLNNLRSAPNSTQERKRVGRGPGSGTGTTAGKGGKGQTARTGVAVGIFEGGQTPIYRRLPKIGQPITQNNRIWKEISIETLEHLVVSGKLSNQITLSHLKEKGMIKGYERLAIIGKGALSKAVSVQAHKFTSGARQAIESAKGSCLKV